MLNESTDTMLLKKSTDGRRFKKVMILGEWEPELCNPNLSLEEACERYARTARAAGATALQLNFLATPYHPLLYTHPDEYYLYFDNYAASLDMFAESEFSAGLFPKFFLEENLRRLSHLSAAAARHGLTGVLYLGEPRHVPEELFERFPQWRGPRVDNPAASKTPLYALDTDLPDVREHYGQLLRQVLKHAPNVEDIILFVHDSGVGFSHSLALYAGPNGPFGSSRFFGRPSDVGGRIAGFCSSLRRAALDVVPQLDVTLTSQLPEEERNAVVAVAEPNVHVSIWGRESRTGGLEDQWAYFQLGPRRLAEEGFEKAREERMADFSERVRVVKESGRKPRFVLPAPNEHYFQNHYVPNPWEQLEILTLAENWGADQVLGKGLATDNAYVPYNINQESFSLFVQTPGLTPEEAVAAVIEEWVQPFARPLLLNAFRAMEEAVRRRPAFNVYAQRDVNFMPGPLVPDPSAITKKEKAHYWNVALDTITKIKGNPILHIPNLNAEQLGFILGQLQNSTFPAIERALGLLDEILRNPTTDAATRECVACQVRHIRAYRCLQKSLKYWAQMTAHWRGVSLPEIPAASDIVQQEIENTRDWMDVLGATPGEVLRLGPPGVLYGQTWRIVEDLQTRIQVMTKYQNDKPRNFGEPRLALIPSAEN